MNKIFPFIFTLEYHPSCYDPQDLMVRKPHHNNTAQTKLATFTRS